MNWLNCLTIFENVAKNQSFAAAARALSLPNSVITKRVKELEAQLGSSLFSRTTRQVQLTEAGQLLYDKIQPLLGEWDDIRRQLMDFKEQPQGQLNFCFPPNISSHAIFMKPIEAVRKALPKMEISLSTTHAPFKLSDSNIDLFIATEKYLLDPDRVVGVHLFNFTYHCYASPSFIKKHGEPKTPSDLKNFNCVRFANQNQWAIGKTLYPISGLFNADSGDAAIAAGVNHIGIIYAPDFMVANEVKEKKLICLFPKVKNKIEMMKLFYVKHAYKPRKIEIATGVFKTIFSVDEAF